MWIVRELAVLFLTWVLFSGFILATVVVAFEWAAGCGEAGGSCIWLVERGNG